MLWRVSADLHLSPWSGISGTGVITMVGIIGRGWGVKRRKADAFTLSYVERGSGIYRDESGVEHAISSGSLIVVPPDLEHTYGPRPGHFWRELYIVFQGPLFEVLRPALRLEQPVCELRPARHWSGRVGSFIRGLGGVDGPSGERTLFAFLSLLGDIAQSRPEPATGWLERARFMLQSEGYLRSTIPEIAAELGMPYGTFRKRFRSLVGRSPTEYRQNARMTAARELLLRSAMSTAQIAERLGFCDEFHLSRQVWRHFRMRPGELRAVVRGSCE